MQVDEFTSLVSVTIAAVTLVVALIVLRYQRQDRKPIVEPWKFHDGAKWQIGVRCLRGPVLKCNVDLGGVALQPETEDTTPGYRPPYAALAQGNIATWRVPEKVGEAVVHSESDLTVSVKDGDQVLLRISFKDIRTSRVITSITG